MTLHAEAIHDQGVLRLLGPLPIANGQRVKVVIFAEDDDGFQGNGPELEGTP